MNLKLPTHLPNEKPKPDVLPASLPSKPPLALPAIPNVNKLLKSKPIVNHQLLPPLIQQERSKDEPQDEPQDETAGILEEEAYTSVKLQSVPIPIPGTSIVLNTDEDIAKWIEERKKNWPSKRRMEEKQNEAPKKRVFDDADNENSSSNKKQKRYCKFFIKGNCRNQHCPNLHEIPIKPIQNNKLVYHHGLPINIPERYSKSVNSGKSLHNLVIEHDHYKFENDKVLKLIENLVQGGYIKSNYEKYKK